MVVASDITYRDERSCRRRLIQEIKSADAPTWKRRPAEAVSQREYVIAVTLIYDKLAHSEKLPNDHDCLSF